MAFVLIFALLTGATGSAIREVSLTNNFLSHQMRSNPEMTIIATVKSDPTWGSAKVIGARLKAPSMSALVSLQSVSILGHLQKIHLPIRITSNQALVLIPGDRFEATGRMTATKERKVAALFVVHGQIRVLSRANQLQQVASAIRKNFREQAGKIGGDSGALIPGLVLGDTSMESAGFIAKMRRVGLTHLTAVSGANFAIVAAFILWLLQWVFRRQGPRILTTSFVLIGFIFLVRPSPSVLRATVMSAVLLIAKLRGVRSNPIPSLGLAIALLVLVDPFQATDPGFALSVSATAGILLLAPGIEEFLVERFCGPKLAELLAIPISATIMCTPIIIAISGTLSIVSIPANLLVAPVIAPITVLGFIAALFPPITHLLLVLINPLSKVIVLVANKAAGFPVISISKSFVGAGIFLAVVLSIRYLRKKVLALFLIPGLVIAHYLGGQWPGRDWQVVNCNVGQGDMLVINLGSNQGIVIDVGPDSKLADNCLKAIHVKKIALLVLTHFHADHVMGLTGALYGREVGAAWVTDYSKPQAEREQVVSELEKSNMQIVHQDSEVEFDSPRGRVNIKVLWPRLVPENFAALPGDGSSINNSSVALVITIGKLRIFDPGDLEPPAQEALLNSNQLNQVDILKVAHHGSAYQFLPLLDRLHPKLALISVGVGNSYGHPAPSTIAALTSRGIRVRRTDLDGAISVDSALRIRTKKNDWWNISWG